MNALLKLKNTGLLTLLLGGLVWSATAFAQGSDDRPDLPEPEVDPQSCQNIDWNQDLLNEYPWVADSCREVVTADGQKWARFEARFQKMHPNGSFSANFLNQSGSYADRINLKPAPGQKVLIDNREYAFSELRRGQTLNFYAPEGLYGFVIEPGDSESEMIEVGELAEEEPPRLAPAEPAAEEQPERLPTTAGYLPLYALGGLLALIGGFGMTAHRRRKQLGS